MNQLQIEPSQAVGGPVRPPLTSIFNAGIYKPTTSIIYASDITLIICLRAHADNSWVMDRLRLIRGYYDPLPRVLIIDFGSANSFSEEIAEICEKSGFDYWHEPDANTYSPAAAHNRGYEKSQTDLIFFCDVDCFGPCDMFGRMAKLATALRMKDVIDTPFVLPVYHLNEPDTEGFFAQTSAEDRSRYLDAFTYYSGQAAFRKAENFFIAPYSNVFLINRRMFSLTGGYDERFRGHGSEDFEFLTRLSLYIKNLPVPVNVETDWLGPLTKNFHKARPYSGFRRLLEALAKPAENFGLKVHHLYHPKVRSAAWESNNDWKRERMKDAFATYIRAQHQLLDVDFLKRESIVACLCKHIDQWGYFTPLRLAGFKLCPVFDDHSETIAEIVNRILAGEIDAVAIFNPHMKSHANFKQIVTLARERGLKIIVVERGALPGTIYYDDEVAYASEAFSEARFLAAIFSPEDLATANAYIADLKTGKKTLENMDSYEDTAARYPALSQQACFIPLQLEDDMAVTLFQKGEQAYGEFASSIEEQIDRNPDITFIVKPHPLSKLDGLSQRPNLIIAAREDNIHFLLDIASFTVCYNSGVGLLSLIHQKPTATLGNAFYNMANAGVHCASLEDAIQRYLAGHITAPPADTIARIVAWFILRRYSNFIATDSISEFTNRKAHGYKDILVTHFRWRGHDLPLGRQKEISPFTKQSYVWAQLSDSLQGTAKRKPQTIPFRPVAMHRRPLVPIARMMVKLLGRKQDVLDYNSDPAGFFAKLKNPWYRRVGAALFPLPPEKNRSSPKGFG